MAAAYEQTIRVIKRREPQVLVEYQRNVGYPWMIVGYYRNMIVADKIIKRLSRLMQGTNFRTR